MDRGHGACALRRPNVAALVEQALLHRHGEHYEMLAWVVMPNHVHVLDHVWNTPLWKMVKRWKTWVATHAERRDPARRGVASSIRAERELGAPAAFWQREYWDTYMRDAEQERKAIRYIEGNPVRAKLVLDPAAWPFSSARFRDPKSWELRLPRPRAASSGSAR